MVARSGKCKILPQNWNKLCKLHSFPVPIARLAAAQAALENLKKKKQEVIYTLTLPVKEILQAVFLQLTALAGNCILIRFVLPGNW